MADGIVGGAMPQERGAAQTPQEAHGGGSRSANQRDMLMAVQGFLYDKRSNVVDAVIDAIRKSRTPAEMLVASVADVVQSVADQIGYQGDPRAILPIVMMVMGQMLELAIAAGVNISREDIAAAAQGMAQGQGAPHGQQAMPQAGPPAQPNAGQQGLIQQAQQGVAA